MMAESPKPQKPKPEAPKVPERFVFTDWAAI